MEKESVMVKCCPCSVVVKRLNSADIIRWKNKKKPAEKRRNRWKRGNYNPRRRKKNSGGKERSKSKLTFHGDSHKAKDPDMIEKNEAAASCNSNEMPAFVEDNDCIKTNETRDSLIMEKNYETFPLWKYKRKRSPSPHTNDEFVAKRAPVNVINTNVESKTLQISLERLPSVSDESIVQEVQLNNFDNSVETDGQVMESILSGDGAKSIVVDNCDGANREKKGDKILSPIRVENEEIANNDTMNKISSFHVEPPNVPIKIESSSDEEESEIANNEDHLTDLCLMHEAIVLITRLEDVMDALENNYNVPDIKYLSNHSLQIIRNVKYSWNTSDDTSYCLVMSPDTEESRNFDDLSNKELENESDSDDSYIFKSLKLRPSINRRRISSEESSSEDDVSENLSNRVPAVLSVSEKCNSPKQVSTPNKDNNNTAPSDDSSRKIQKNIPICNKGEEPIESSISSSMTCTVCKEIFDNSEKQLNHTCSPLETTKKNSNKSQNEGRKGKKQRINPKVSSLECNICLQTCESREQLSDHVFKHTPREHQDAYRDAQRQSCGNNTESSTALMTLSESDETQKNINYMEGINYQPGVAVMIDTKKNGKSPKGKSMSVAICPCHTDELQPTDLTVQIEMVLYCEICQVLFRRSHCFETHYRRNATCNQDRRKGRLPRLFCSTCRVVLNTLSDMRKHLEKHASINRHGTVTFVCNICQVVFFGVGTVFCTHWFSHDKDPMFIASQHSFPKFCVSDRGRKPVGTVPGEQYLFVAEYVCRLCKQQFSSDGELSSHECKFEDPKQQQQQSVVPASLPQNLSKDFSTMPKTKKSFANRSNSMRESSDSPVSLQISEERDVQNENVIQQEEEEEEVVVPAPVNERPVILNERSSLRPPVKRPPVQKFIIQDDSPAIKHSPIQNRNSSMNIWICDICNDSFPNLRALGDHAPVHFTDSISSENLQDPKKNYICTVCQHSCASLKLLGAHWGKHDLMRYTCSVCKDTWLTLSAFSRHIVVLCGKHNPTCRVSYSINKEFCKICQIVYKDVKDLQMHNSVKHGSNSSTIDNSKGVPQKSSNHLATPEEKISNSPVCSTNELERKTPNDNCANNNYPSAVLSQPTVASTIEESSTIPFVLCVQPTNVMEPTTEPQQPLNNSYFINIAIPNTAAAVQAPAVDVADNVIAAVSPQKVRALEDPTVQVVLAQPNLLDSTISASLVTNTLPLETVEGVTPNTSTFTLMVRDTTAVGAEVITNTPPTVTSESIIANNPAINPAYAILKNIPPIIQTTGLTCPVVQNYMDKPASTIQALQETNSTHNNNNDDVQIIEVSMITKETSVQPSLPIKLNSTSKTPRVSSDSDVELLSEVTVLDETHKSDDEKIPVEDKTEATTDESSETSGPETILVANPLSRPRGFLRVKNLAELRDNTNASSQVSGNNDKGINTLTQHLLASLETLKSPTEKNDSTTLGILVDGKNKSAATSVDSNKGYMPGKRTLPYIPQRIIGKDVRRANPLSSRPDQSNISKPMNRVTPIPTSNNNMINTNSNGTINQELNYQEQLPNPTVNSQAVRPNRYTCPMCPQYHYDSLDKFIRHLYLHPNMPPNVQELVRYLMNRKNSQRMYQERPKAPSQNQLQLEIHSQPNSSMLFRRNKYKCLTCSAYETDSPIEFQKHQTTHSHQVVNSQNQNTMSFYQQMTSFNSFQSDYNQSIYEQQYPYQIQSIQQPQATQQINSIPPQAYCCNLCGNYQLPSYEEFQKHIQMSHNTTFNTSERNACSFCPQETIFSNEQELKHHEDTQHPFICNVCLQRFSTAYNLNTHCSLHHQNGQYSNNFYSN